MAHKKLLRDFNQKNADQETKYYQEIISAHQDAMDQFKKSDEIKKLYAHIQELEDIPLELLPANAAE